MKIRAYIICLSKFRMKKVFISSSPSLGLETMNNRENYLQAFSNTLIDVLTRRLLMTITYILDPYQDRQKIGPDLGPKPFDTLIVFLKNGLKS